MTMAVNMASIIGTPKRGCRSTALRNQTSASKFEGPRQYDGRDKTDGEDDDQHAKRRFVQAESGEYRLHHLDNNPGNYDVTGRHTKYLATLKFSEQ